MTHGYWTRRGYIARRALLYPEAPNHLGCVCWSPALDHVVLVDSAHALFKSMPYAGAVGRTLPAPGRSGATITFDFSD